MDIPDASTGRFLARIQQGQKNHTRIVGMLNVTFRVVTAGAPAFLYNSEAYNTCTYPANVRPHFYIGKQINGIYGWWAVTDSYPDIFAIETNVNNTTTISIPLVPGRWSNNLGQRADQDADTLAAFQKSLGNVSELGVSIGGGCFYGHGVNVSGGTAQLQLLNLEVQ